MASDQEDLRAAEHESEADPRPETPSSPAEAAGQSAAAPEEAPASSGSMGTNEDLGGELPPLLAARPDAVGAEAAAEDVDAPQERSISAEKRPRLDGEDDLPLPPRKRYFTLDSAAEDDETPAETASDRQASSEAPAGSAEATTEVRTIIISGIPGNCYDREVSNMFRFDSRSYDYKGCTLHRMRRAGVVAFVAFGTHADAVAAVEQYHGVQFDPEMAETKLKVELATPERYREEMALEERYELEGRPPTAMPRGKAVATTRGGRYGARGGPDGGANVGVNGAGGTGLLRNIVQPYGGGPVPYGYGGPASATGGGRPVDKSGGGGGGDIPPGSTLYVGGLSRRVTEEEVLEVFQPCAGFQAARIARNVGTQPVAFVDFATPAHASQAMNQMQGRRLASSDPRFGLRIQFARQQMRR
ncbi:hypothetical protein CDCA_CDCA12G3429 [Cyanidium caldarium]|uniref:RRM domain-containing protein n=1 Tax=Cyanidium caldarium TaxID=2771 RepID=A0AAV9IYT2_CYACA|nr:hypothetical protein CDCA_CDCA12G3429 [Cyanidium caldarium]